MVIDYNNNYITTLFKDNETRIDEWIERDSTVLQSDFNIGAQASDDKSKENLADSISSSLNDIIIQLKDKVKPIEKYNQHSLTINKRQDT
jgi:hypothetical protein